MDIRLSKEHGVNPSLSYCPICGKDMDVVLFGRLPNDEQAPRKVPSAEPCDGCKEEIDGYEKQGVVFLVIDDRYHEFKNKSTPWVFFHSLHVIKREAADRLTNGFTKDKSKVFMDLSVAKRAGIVKDPEEGER